MNKKNKLEQNKDLKIKDIDIATVEAMRDRLLDFGVPIEDLAIKRSFELTNKMYEVIHPIYRKQPTSKTILEESNDIIFNRAEEKQREYGPIDESLKDASIVASMISNEDITTKMVYAVLIGLKISRLRWNKKHDTFLDSIGYMAAFENYIRKTENNE